jgi:hypothetical protein
MIACRQLGGAAHWLERDGLLLPSARSSATNLVTFPATRSPDARFEILKETPGIIGRTLSPIATPPGARRPGPRDYRLDALR